MNYLPALVIILVVVILVMATWVFSMVQISMSQLKEQLEERNLSILRQETEIKRLTTIIASKDPMTYQILSVPQTLSSNFEIVDTYKTEEEEAREWAERTGRVDLDEDLSDDLKMLGLS